MRDNTDTQLIMGKEQGPAECFVQLHLITLPLNAHISFQKRSNDPEMVTKTLISSYNSVIIHINS